MARQMTSRVELAVAILTMNEAENIGSVIDSVAEHVGRVVVIDSGSSDSTVHVARVKGATVLANPVVGPFDISAQRNWAVAQLRDSCKWLLFLDADERASQRFIDNVVAVIEEGAHDAFVAAPRFWYQGTWLKRFTGYPNWHPRLVRTQVVRDPFVGGTWERFHPDLRVGQIREPYEHYANSKGLDDWIGRHLRYARAESSICNDAQEAVRRRGLRKLARLSGSTRPICSLAYFMLARRGILDGGSVVSYARRRLIYELMIVEMRRQLDRDASGLPR